MRRQVLQDMVEFMRKKNIRRRKFGMSKTCFCVVEIGIGKSDFMNSIYVKLA